ncbi:MAG TPA: hypothetical protein PLB12_03750 [Candidatus Goldiibacteriota bacterium]|nr:hypothetical protein [Candidatus Goldiibacteriota bacterium]HRQ43441.1 hypothetical protein [Candidatus Goldiibacteriota bacterium]
MRLKTSVTAVLAVLMAAAVYAYIPENTEENGFDQRVVTASEDVSALVEDGVKAIRQEVVSSSYSNERTSELTGRGIKESESGSEEVASKEILYFEPKEEIYEAQEMMDEMLLWLEVYRTTDGSDVVVFKKIKELVKSKKANIDSLIDALKYQKDNKDSVLEIKRKIKKNDKDLKFNLKRLKGDIKLISGKPLPEPKE